MCVFGGVVVARSGSWAGVGITLKDVSYLRMLLLTPELSGLPEVSSLAKPRFLL